MRRPFLAALGLLLGLMAGGVTVPPAVADTPRRHADEAMGTWRQEGWASWYGPGFHGRRTACGQTYDQDAQTAAHRWFPCGTRLRVTNLRNGRSVLLTVTDRGPFIRGRVIDLSRGAARRLGIEQAGLGEVRIEVLP